MVARVVWERCSVYPRCEQPKPGAPCDTGVCGIFPFHQTEHKIRFDHRIDHRQHNLKNQYPGVAQLVGRHIWDVEAGRSSRPTRTKSVTVVDIISATVIFVYSRSENILTVKSGDIPHSKQRHDHMAFQRKNSANRSRLTEGN